jgi:hypothetical protein
MSGRRIRINTISDDSSVSDSGEDSVTEIQQDETVVKEVQKEGTKTRSWVYDHSEKIITNGIAYFYCRCEFKNGRKCSFKVKTKQGQTSIIANHLREKHSLKPQSKLVQPVLSFENMPQKSKPKTFRQAFAALLVKQYLPFSLINEEVLQDAFLNFHKEWEKNGIQPAFVTDKTVAADIANMADTYITEMKTRFKSKLSLCMDAWTGPNKMSFLGITFTYLDEDFKIQRGLLEMVKMKGKHSGAYIGSLFKQALSLYGIKKDMIGGVTQDNAANCGTCVEALVKDGFDRGVFYGCFLHIMNLACQAAIQVYDPVKKSISVRRTVLTTMDDKSESEDSQDEEDPDFDDYEMDQYAEELKDVLTESNAILCVSLFVNKFIFLIQRQGN